MGDEQTLPRSKITGDEQLPVGVDRTTFQDAIHGALAESTRRTTLEYLARHPKATRVERLATELAASERGIPAEAVTDDQQAETLVTLKHVHLPKLHETGLVEWDRHTDHVSATPLLAQLPVTSLTGGFFELPQRSNQGR